MESANWRLESRRAGVPKGWSPPTGGWSPEGLESLRVGVPLLNVGNSEKKPFAKLCVNFALLCVTASYKFRKVAQSLRRGPQRDFKKAFREGSVIEGFPTFGLETLTVYFLSKIALKIFFGKSLLKKKPVII
jgi:hypothetical protein